MKEKKTEIIYIIDDEKDILDCLELFFNNLGHIAIGFTNIRDFDRAVETFIPSAVITDLRLKEESGLNLISKINGLTQIIPVFVISAFLDKVSKFELTELGVLDYEEKPFLGSEYASRVDSLLIQYRRGTLSNTSC